MKTLLDVVQQVESGGNYAAIRFEPGLYRTFPGWVADSIPQIQQRNPGLSVDTYHMIACTSWGGWQMLGANIWRKSNPYHGSLSSFTSSGWDQLQCANLFMADIGFDGRTNFETMTDDDLHQFARAWNGPGAVETYIASMERAYKELTS